MIATTLLLAVHALGPSKPLSKQPLLRETTQWIHSPNHLNLAHKDYLGCSAPLQLHLQDQLFTL